VTEPADPTPHRADAAAADATPSDPKASALHRALRPARVLHARGPASFLNLNLYSFGLTGLWTAVGSDILPLMVSDMIARGPIRFLGFEFQKNGAISIIAIAGGVVVGITQPLAGWLSDRTIGPLGKRLPYIAGGTIGLVPITIILGIMDTFLPLILIFIGIQFFGNIAQGPANALLRDHVPASQFGSASGGLILTRALGAGLIVAAVLGLMSNYDDAGSPQWLWASLAVVSAVVIITVSWTFTSLRPRGAGRKSGRPLVSIRAPATPGPAAPPDAREETRHGFGLFLIALTVIVAGMSSMSVYAVFYMEDMVAPENPAEGLLLVMAVMVPTVGLTVMPAGRLSDRIGRTRMLVAAGLLGAFGVLLLAFVPKLPVVLVAAIPTAISVSASFTVLWALANDLVAPGSAARDLGFTGLAFLVGGILARFAGFGVDALNNQSENLGYRVLLFVIAAAFILTPVVLQRMARLSQPLPPQDPGARTI
jgi:MFS family permease